MFKVHFMEFNHEGQKWIAECLIGEELVLLGSQSGMEKWYIVDHPEVIVAPRLCRHLTLLTIDALKDYHLLENYRKAIGECPARTIQ